MKLDGWIEVFRAGKYPQGDFSRDDVRRIAANYDRGFHEAPSVVGHPKTDAPAYGWVSELKEKAGVLLAKFDAMPDGLRRAIESGRLRKRSVALYRDLDGRGPYLRHVGWLGAEPPAVKGLQPAFEESAGSAEYLEIEQEAKTMDLTMDGVRRVVNDALAEFAERVGLKKSGEANADAASGDAVKAAVASAVTELRSELEAQFAEREKEMRDEITELRNKDSEFSEQQSRKTALEYVEKAATQGRLTPAAKPAAEALAGLLASDSTTVEFGEGDAKKSVSGVDLFGEFLAKLPDAKLFGERTGKLKTAGRVVEFTEPGDGTPVENSDLAARAAKIASERKLEYGEALKAARLEMGVA